MKIIRILKILVLALGLLVSSVQSASAAPLGTAFTYQGQLYDNNYPANGRYDFTFALYDADVGGNKLGTDINVADVNVIDGYSTIELDFGSSVFDGNARWLGIGIRPGVLSDPNPYTFLSPRQKVTPTPYAIQTRGIFVDSSGNVGIGTTSPGQKLSVGGTVESTNGGFKFPDGSVQTKAAPVALFGEWVDKTGNYGAQQAATDGFVVVYGMDSLIREIDVCTDSNPNPTTIRQAGLGWSNSGGAASVSFTVPVRKNDYWKVVCTNGVPATFKVWWIPLGN